MDDNTKHKANFLASLFLMSKFSLKYGLTPHAICILRYVCDCLDIGNYKAVQLSQRQIAIYSRCHVETVTIQVRKLSKLRIIKIHKSDKNKTKFTYAIGPLLIAFANKSVRISEKSVRISDTKRPNLYGKAGTSYNKASNNISNKNFHDDKKQKPVDNFTGYADVQKQSTSYQPPPEITVTRMPENLRKFVNNLKGIK